MVVVTERFAAYDTIVREPRAVLVLDRVAEVERVVRILAFCGRLGLFLRQISIGVARYPSYNSLRLSTLTLLLESPASRFRWLPRMLADHGIDPVDDGTDPGIDIRVIEIATGDTSADDTHLDSLLVEKRAACVEDDA